MTDKNLDIMTQELIYSDFADLIVSYRLKGTIEDCFSYLDTINNMEDNEYLLTDYQDNIEMIRACVKVLQWFTIDNYDETLREVNKYSMKVEEMFG